MSAGYAQRGGRAASLDPAFTSLAERVASAHIPAAALAVGDAEGPLRKEAFAAPGERPVDAESMFFLASVTKPIFATALMQLVEEGSLELHEPITRYLPEFAGGGKEQVTIWHLLTHTSGVQDLTTELIRRSRPSAARMTRLTLEAPLRFEPGTRWDYCSTSFLVLAEIVRRVTGMTAARLMRERLFDPLGMRHTTFDPRRAGRPIVPVQGVGADNRIRRFLLLRYVVSISHPGGGLFGTLDDLLRFGAALLRPRRDRRRWLPVAPATFELMSQDHVGGLPAVVEGVERPIHHGLGWGKPTLSREMPGSARVVDHGGATGTRLWIDPDAELVFVYFTTRWEPDRGPELDALRATYRAFGTPAPA
ncbi:MAG: beta-lactamase family protein [Chloroflexota bacterium]|nr:beta-lactamase family protein [Chloroflexota bacterium]